MNSEELRMTRLITVRIKRVKIIRARRRKRNNYLVGREKSCCKMSQRKRN